MAGAVKTLALWGELTMAVLINVPVVKLPSKYLCLSTWICAAFSIGQSSFFLQWVVANSDTHDWSK